MTGLALWLSLLCAWLGGGLLVYGVMSSIKVAARTLVRAMASPDLDRLTTTDLRDLATLAYGAAGVMSPAAPTDERTWWHLPAMIGEIAGHLEDLAEIRDEEEADLCA